MRSDNVKGVHVNNLIDILGHYCNHRNPLISRDFSPVQTPNVIALDKALNSYKFENRETSALKPEKIASPESKKQLRNYLLSLDFEMPDGFEGASSKVWNAIGTCVEERSYLNRRF